MNDRDVSTVGAHTLLRLPHVPPPVGDVAQLADWGRRHRLLGVLRAAQFPGHEDLTEALREQSIRTAVLLREAATVLDAIGRVAGRTVLLKGAAVAHLDYPEAWYRGFEDVDVLVRPDQIEAAVTVVAGLGGRVVGHHRYTRSFQRNFVKAVTLRMPSGAEVDLHQTLADEPFGALLNTADLLDRAVPLVLGSHEVLALGRGDRLLHAALHAVTNGPGWATAAWADLWLCASAATAEEVDEAITTATSLHCGAPLALAVREAERRTGVPIPAAALHDFADQWTDSWWDRLAIRGFWPARDQRARSLATVIAVPGRVGYARAALLPDREYLRLMETTRLGWLAGILVGGRGS